MRLRLLTENQLLRLVGERRKDAQVLFEQQRYNGSVYMAGYSVECALKASICRQLDEPTMRPVLATHDLDVLVGRTPRSGVPVIMLWASIKDDASVLRDFELLKERWSSELRYETKDVNKQTAKEALAAATRLTDWLGRQYPDE